MIDITKTYTFDGESGTVLTTTRPFAGFPVVWMNQEGVLRTFTSEGRYSVCGLVKLREVRPTRWVNVYTHTVSGPYDSREIAHANAGSLRIACIEFSEGDGI